MSKHIICSGIATVDLMFSSDEIPMKSIKYRANSSQIVSGGCGLNAAIAVSRLCGKSSLASLIGNDIFADLIVKELIENKISLDFLIRSDQFETARSSIVIDPQGERQIMNYRGEFSNELIAQIKPSEDFDAILFDTRWFELAKNLLETATQHKKIVVLDAEAPTAPAMEYFKYATHIAFSETGLTDFAPNSTIEDALKSAQAQFDAWVCVTRGELPVISFDGEKITTHPVFSVDVKDTLGAGDVWHGAFTLFLAEGYSEGDAVHRANAVAALKTTRIGGGSVTPTLKELERFLERN